MRILLDSHVFLWAAHDESMLSNAARSVIADENAEVYLSAASVWELSIKVSLGRLILNSPLEDILRNQEEVNGVLLLPVLPLHALKVQDLESHHRDPFDTMLVAQCIVEDLTLVSKDATLDAYPIRRHW